MLTTTTTPTPAKIIPPCRRCGPAGAFAFWFEDRAGRRRIRLECRRCRWLIKFAPHVEPFISMADAASSQTDILDVLTRLDAIGVELVSDGRGVSYAAAGWHKVPRDLHALVRSCSHRLAKLLGKRRATK